MFVPFEVHYQWNARDRHYSYVRGRCGIRCSLFVARAPLYIFSLAVMLLLPSIFQNSVSSTCLPYPLA